MDAVNAFNGEMLSMMDTKPPISRAKMMSVTKAGIKAIKFYKHVVQIVEKFIKRCKPDLKVAGLYVVDSIIRQSRHQFGADKDVFGPRFLKNFTATFQNLYQCPADDKGKILRVLNLWQKNDVFGMDIIQPLLDMATGPVLPVLENGTTVDASPASSQPAPAASMATPPPALQNPMALAAVAQLLQGTQGIELQQLIQTLQQSGGAGVTSSAAPPTEQKPSLAKTLLDRFDYDDDPEPVEEKDEPTPAAPPTINLPLELQQALQAHLLSQIANQSQMQAHVASQGFPDAAVQNQIPDQTSIPDHIHNENNTLPNNQQPLGPAVEMDRPVHDGRDRRHRRSRSRSPRRRSSSRSRRSRSGSRSRRSRFHHTRSRSRERRGRSPRGRSEERRERERERDRRQKGLPTIRKEHLSVCSTTLWIGQLDKRTQQQDIMSLMEEFGQIESINMIPPRGCAYIVMVHRQDAYTALNKLSRGGAKVNQKAIKIAWALNKGIKTEFKRFWDVDLGVTYIPWGKVKPEDIDNYKGGGMIDTETLKPEWKGAPASLSVPVTGGPGGKQGDGAAVPAVSQSTAVQPMAAGTVHPGPTPHMSLPPSSMITGGPPPSFPPPGFNPPQMPTGFPPLGPVAPMNFSSPPLGISEKPMEKPQKDPHEGPKGHMDPSGGLSMSPTTQGPLLGPRPGPLLPHPPMGPRPPFMPPFSNDVPRPNIPHPNMPPQMMPPRGPNPMYGEPPAGRFRMPMMSPPVEDFPPPREGFPPQGPPRGPRDAEHWEEEPPWNDWREHGSERVPERFGNEPPFRRGGWSRGGPRGRGRFGN